MPRNPPQDLSPPEFLLLKSAAKLLVAVRWLQEHPPLPEKLEYLNSKVKDEIISIGTKFSAYASSSEAPRLHPIVQLMTAEWKNASDNGRQPRWNILTDGYIRQACEQVAEANPDWHADLYATDLSKHTAQLTTKSKWWVLPGSRPSAAKGSADVSMAEPVAAPSVLMSSIPPTPSAPSVPDPSVVAPAAPPPPPSPPGLLTRAAKGKAKAHAQMAVPPLPVTITSAPAAPSAAPYNFRKKKLSAAIINSSDESDGSGSGSGDASSDEDTPKKAKEMPPGVAVPQVLVEVASPTRPEAEQKQNLPFAIGDDRCGPCIKTGQIICEARSSKGNRLRTACSSCNTGKKTCANPRPHWARPIFDAMRLTPSPSGRGIDDDTRRQLNRVEAMLNAICSREGIIPETLPGYEAPRSASPSTHSLSSTSGPMERLHLSDAASEPPRKLARSSSAVRGRSSGRTSSSNSRGSSLGRA